MDLLRWVYVKALIIDALNLLISFCFGFVIKAYVCVFVLMVSALGLLLCGLVGCLFFELF